MTILKFLNELTLSSCLAKEHFSWNCALIEFLNLKDSASFLIHCVLIQFNLNSKRIKLSRHHFRFLQLFNFRWKTATTLCSTNWSQFTRGNFLMSSILMNSLLVSKMSLVVTTSLPASKESSRTLGDSHFCNSN